MHPPCLPSFLASCTHSDPAAAGSDLSVRPAGAVRHPCLNPAPDRLVLSDEPVEGCHINTVAKDSPAVAGLDTNRMLYSPVREATVGVQASACALWPRLLRCFYEHHQRVRNGTRTRTRRPANHPWHTPPP